MTDQFDISDDEAKGYFARDNAQGAREAGVLASDKDPDRYAKAMTLANKRALPVDAVYADFDHYANLDKLDSTGDLDPKTASFVSDPKHMALAHDDFDGMTTFAKAVEAATPYLQNPLMAIGSGIGALAKRESSVDRLRGHLASGTLQPAGGFVRSIGEGLNAAVFDPVRDYLQSLHAPIPMALSAPGLELGDSLVARGASVTEAGQQASEIASEGVTHPTFANALTDPGNTFDFYTGMFAESLPMMMTAILGGKTLGPAVGGATQAAQTFGEDRAAGHSTARSALDAAIQGGLEWAGEVVPFGEAFAKGTGSFLRRLSRTATAESISEVFTQLGQDQSSVSVLGEHLTLTDRLRNAFDAFLLGGMMSGPLAAAGASSEIGHEQRVQQARDDIRRSNEIITRFGELEHSVRGAKALDDITEAAAKLKLGERSPEVAAAFADHVGGKDANVYIPASEFRTLFQESDAAGMAEQLTGDPNALALAGETGDLVIPLAKYVSVVARLPNAPEIAHVARLSAEGHSRKDIEGLDFEAEVAAVEGKAPQQGDEFAGAVDNAKTGILAALQATGRFKPADAELMANLQSRMLGVIARRSAATPEQATAQLQAIVQKHALRINGQPTYNGAPTGDGNGTPGSTDAGSVPDGRGLRGSDGLLAEPIGPPAGDAGREADGSLRGLPRSVSGGFTASAHEPAARVAQEYMAARGETYAPANTFVPVDKARGARIADAYEALQHDPSNPEVAAAYAAMIDETLAQYEAALAAGLQVEFITGDDPYAGNPRLMIEDVRNNNHVWVLGTHDAFGSDAEFDPVDNPLLAETSHTDIHGRPMLVNDVFRVVHDYFGHVKEGVGFRASGEENAWRAHSAMYSPLARRAMTTETRGQNSWVNFGPHGGSNRTASTGATIFADQKIGLLPEWVSEEGVGDEQVRTLDQAGSDRPIDYDKLVTVGGAVPEAGWAARTAIVGDDGKPAVIHRGSRDGRTSADDFQQLGASTGNPSASLGVWLTDDPADAAKYGQVGDYFLDLRNPKVYDLADFPGFDDADEAGALRRELQAAGHDSVLIDGRPYGGPVQYVVFKPTQVIPHDTTLFQDAARNEIGLYSAVEQAVLDLKLPGWKTKEGKVAGPELWNKIKSVPGIKAEELKWLGLEDYLHADNYAPATHEIGPVKLSSQDIEPTGFGIFLKGDADGAAVDVFNSEAAAKEAMKGARFTREQVAKFVRNNGVSVEETIGDQQGADSDAEFSWNEQVDDDSSNWDGRDSDLVYEVEHDHQRDYSYWWDWDEWVAKNDSKVGEAFGLTDDQVSDLTERSELERFVKDNGGTFDYDKLFELAKDDIGEAANDRARDEYMDNPVTIYTERETSMEIVGNDDYGYTVRGPASEHVADNIYSFSEAEIQARDWAMENGLLQDEDAETTAKWGDYIASGRMDNYREYKLKVPDLPGRAFVYNSHFPDENIIAFLRVTDRALPVTTEAESQDMTDADNARRLELMDADDVGDLTPEERNELGALNHKRQVQLNGHKLPVVNTFFVEENQSDLHQHGRREGYRLDLTRQEEAALLEATHTTANALAETFEANASPSLVRDIIATLDIREDADHPGVLASMHIAEGKQASALAKLLNSTTEGATIAKALKAWNASEAAVQAQRSNVPDAPFKDDAWLNLSLKRALVLAVEQGRDGLAWVDSQTLVDRWSERYRTLYENQYDKKMVSMVEKLTGLKAQHFTMDGQPYPKPMADADYEDKRAGLVAREEELEAGIHALPGFPSDANDREQALWVRNNAPDTRDEVLAIRAQRDALARSASTPPTGYWAIPLDDALHAKIEREGFPLFQPAGDGSGKQGQITIASDRTMAITLFESANLSTFFHESAHFFLEVMTDLAADPDTSQQVKDDFAAIQRFVGARPGQPFTTDQHETWARSFELYLRTGRAPAPELVKPFARFRRWMTDLYKHVDDLLRAGAKQLNPEITSVMDRMVAVDEEIELMETRQGHVPLLPRGEAGTLGLTDAQWETYIGMLEAATEEARAEVTATLLRAQQREQQKAWQGEAATVSADLTDAMERSPAFRAWRILTGRTPAGDAAPIEAVTLDRDALAEAYTPAQMKVLRSLNVYRVEGGQHPDAVAGALGFDSGDALVQALLTVREAQAGAPAAVQAEMQRRHPDPMDDGSLPDLVTKALYRSKRVAVLEHELGLLAKVAGQPAPRPGQLRAIAEAVIARKTSRTLRPNDYLVAERKAAREATKAAAKGDFAEALKFKREQALQAALYGRARAAQDTAAAQVAALKKAATPRTIERIGRAGKEYVDALEALLEGHELRPVSGKEVRRRDALRAWVAKMQEDNDETAVSEDLLARVEREQVVNVADLTLPQLAELHEAVKNLLHLAKLKNTLLSNHDARTWEEARGELLARIRQSLAEGTPPPLSSADMTTLAKLGDHYGNLMDWVLQPETVVEWLDGGEIGPWHDYLWNQAETAQAKREELRRKVGDVMAHILADLPKEQLRALNRRVSIKSLGRSLSRNTIVAATLNLGTASNRDKLMRGGVMIDGVQTPFTDEQLVEMLGHLTAADAAMIQRVWDATQLLWPEIVKLQEELTGITPEKVEAQQITIQTKDGPVALRGGYYPLVYDPRASSAGVKQAQAQEEKLFSGGGFTKAVTSKGHVEKRTEYAAPLLLDYHAVLSRHLGDVITDLSHRRFVKQALRILSDTEIKGVIHQRLSSGAYHALLGAVRNAVVGGHSIAEPASKSVEKLKQGVMTNTAVAALGFKVALTVGNLVSAPVQAAARVRLKYLAAGFGRYYAHPIEQTQIIHTLSPMMVARAEGHDTSYEEAIAAMRGKRGLRAKIVTVSLACHRWIVPLVERFVWMGRYMQAQADGHDMAEAIRLADKAIRQTQTKHAPKDLSAAERDPRYKIFNLFIGPLVVINNRMQDAGMRGKLHGAVETPAEALGTWLAMIAGGALIFELMMGRGPDDRDKDGEVGLDDWASWIAKKALLFPLQTIPLLRNVANAFDTYGTGSARPDPVTDAMVAIAKAGKTALAAGDDWLEGEDVDTRKVIKDTTKAAGVALGVPSSQAIVTGEYLYDVGTGEYTPDNPAEAAKYLLYKRPRDE